MKDDATFGGCQNNEWEVKSKFVRHVTKESATKDEWGQIMVIAFIGWCQEHRIDLTCGEELDSEGAAQLYFEFFNDITKEKK